MLESEKAEKSVGIQKGGTRKEWYCGSYFNYITSSFHYPGVRMYQDDILDFWWRICKVVQYTACQHVLLCAPFPLHVLKGANRAG